MPLREDEFQQKKKRKEENNEDYLTVSGKNRKGLTGQIFTIFQKWISKT